MRRRSARSGSRLRRVVRVASHVALVCAVLAAGYLVFVGVRRNRNIAMPAPGGDHRVGRTSFEWTDTSRQDPFAPTAHVPRTLSVWLWYPAKQDTPAGTSAYAPGLWSGLGLSGPAAMFEGPLAKIRPNSTDDPAPARGRFPIVVLEPGMGLSAPEFSALAEGIASRGYIVAGVTPTYSANLTVIAGHAVRSTPAGNPPDLGSPTTPALEKADRLIATWVDDAMFTAARVRALDQRGALAGHVDRGPITYIGHSFGGAAALQACDDDATCAGAVDIDGTQFGRVSRTGEHQPFLILGSANSCVLGTCDPANADDRSTLTTATRFLAMSTGASYRYSIIGTGHFSFTDMSMWYIAPPLRQLFPLGPIDGARCLLVVQAVVAAFLTQIHGAGQGDLQTLAARYPEVRHLA